MNNLFNNKAASAANAKKPPVRREAASRPSPSVPVKPPTNRFQLSANKNSRQSLQPPSKVASRAVAPKRGVKRKSATPQPAFSSDEDSDGSSDARGTSDSDASRKRVKSSVTSIDSGRRISLVPSSNGEEQEKIPDIVHGADLTSGNNADKFMIPWDADSFEEVELQYPGSLQAKERFQLVWPCDDKQDDYKPFEDITETIRTICTEYLPPHLASLHLDETTGYARRFNRAWQRNSVPEFLSIIQDFNTMLLPLLTNGTLATHLRDRSSLSLDWIKRILDQIYARTVSPKVETLRAYENGSDNVYGELLPRFCSAIFAETNLTHDQKFIDLGSGVGNVVLQAALETGCEAWGIEMMPNPCALASLQAREFPHRAALWGLDVGQVHLLQGDFTSSPTISPVLRTADLVLVNNQAFTPALNDTLRYMFLDLKDGCKIVSLKPFVPEGWRITEHKLSDPANQFVQVRKEYFSESVSWTDMGGFYYVATKDPGPLRRFMGRRGLN
ncbi:hypothetical protein MBLNU230_g4550t1 [Neophaeotheca triangularis]